MCIKHLLESTRRRKNNLIQSGKHSFAIKGQAFLSDSSFDRAGLNFLQLLTKEKLCQEGR